MRDDPRLREQLHRDGYRITRQRQIILEEIRQNNEHLTAKELYDTVKMRAPQISLGTVYRSLAVLEELQLVKRVPGEGSCRYDGNTVPHYHINCTRCGQVTDVDTDVFQGLNTEAISRTGFKLCDYQLDLYGVCAECRDTA